jgi:hypothetical protein
MARKAKQQKKICVTCKVDKVLSEFYNTESKMFPDGKVTTCKPCIKEMIDTDDVSSLKEVLAAIDKPYLDYLWNNSLKKNDPVGDYLRQINSLPNYKGMTYKDSVEGSVEIRKVVKVAQEDVSPANPFADMPITEELYKKWGRDFKPIQILEFEDAYEFYKSNYQVKSSMHEAFLKKAVVASVKMDKAIAKGDAKEAEQYSKIFKEMTSAGKLQPRDMTKDDLSDGIDTFSSLVRMVEKNRDIIPILPVFKSKVNDKVDFTIWMYVNYIRDLFGEQPVPYKALHEWMGQKREEVSEEIPEAVEWK